MLTLEQLIEKNQEILDLLPKFKIQSLWLFAGVLEEQHEQYIDPTLASDSEEGEEANHYRLTFLVKFNPDDSGLFLQTSLFAYQLRSILNCEVYALPFDSLTEKDKKQYLPSSDPSSASPSVLFNADVTAQKVLDAYRLDESELTLKDIIFCNPYTKINNVVKPFPMQGLDEIKQGYSSSSQKNEHPATTKNSVTGYVTGNPQAPSIFSKRAPDNSQELRTLIAEVERYVSKNPSNACLSQLVQEFANTVTGHVKEGSADSKRLLELTEVINPSPKRIK